jgi:short-subunit dehydrogenase
MNLVVVADEAEIDTSAREFRATGVTVDAVQADLATKDGVDKLLSAVGGRPAAVLIANAGRGLGRAFLDQDFNDIEHVIDTNVTGTVYLLHRIGQQMRARNDGKILVVGSIAGFMPGTYQAIYNATKAFLDSFSFALRAELRDTNVTVTCLMPGATETEFFERADLMDTKVGTDKKMAADEVAKIGFDAMLRGDGDVVAGWQNKLRAAMSHVLPSDVLAEMHRGMAAPGTAKHR